MEKRERKKELLVLGKKILTKKGVGQLRVCLEDDEMFLARRGIFFAVDIWVFDKQISDKLAKEYYDILGFTPDQAAQIRQKAFKRESEV